MAREHLLVVGWGRGWGGWNREKLRDTPETHTTNRTPYLSALNYEFLVQPTRMEGKNSYCVVKCVIKCAINGTMQSLESIFLQSY